MVRNLRTLQLEFKLEIAAFVLMSNHFHLILLTPEVDIDRVMYFFMKNVTRAIQKRTGRINKIFGGRYKGCLIDNDKYLLNAFKYVYRNPIASKLCVEAQSYPYSTLNPDSIHKMKMENLAQSFDNQKLYRWINHEFNESDAVKIKGGLAKSLFKLKEIR